LTAAYPSNFSTGQIRNSAATASIGLGWRDDIANSQVPVMATYYGDANLSGNVDTIDFNLLATNFSQTGKVWYDGDFNYSGTVDTIDFNLLASNFSQGLAPAAAGDIGSLVPEPAGIALLTLATGALAARRRRR